VGNRLCKFTKYVWQALTDAFRAFTDYAEALPDTRFLLQNMAT
jgi:hypothetical protein